MTLSRLQMNQERPMHGFGATAAGIVTLFLTGILAEPGTSQAKLLADIHPNGSSFPREFTQLGTQLYFRARDQSNEYLWATDGSQARRVSTFVREPTSLTRLGTRIVFSAVNSAIGREVYSVTLSGDIRLVKDVNPGSANSMARDFTLVGTRLFFTAVTARHGRELWVTDGTQSGTRLVKDIASGSTGSDPRHLTALGSTLYFAARTANEGMELWRSDGSSGGTRRVIDLVRGRTGSFPRSLTAYKGNLYFNANGSRGLRLYRTDGTERGTSEWADVEVRGKVIITGLFAYFAGFTQRHGSEPWQLSVAKSGTHALRDLNPGPASSSPVDMTVHRRGEVFFGATGPSRGRELWRVQNGVVRFVRDLTGDNRDGVPFSPDGISRLRSTGSRVVFAGTKNGRHRQLWVSDGSEHGTYAVQEIRPNGDANPREFTVIGNFVVFSANDGTHGQELFAVPRIDLCCGSSTPFGAGCPSSTRSVPVHSGTRPRLGTRLIASLRSAAPTTVAVLYLGRSRTAWGPIPLPIDLAPFGARGCKQLVAGDLQFAVPTDSAGSARLNLPLSSARSTLGYELFTQFVILDPAANRFGIVMSNGLRSLIGSL